MSEPKPAGLTRGAQPPLPGFAPAPARTRSRTRWETELRRALAVFADQRARDRAHLADTVAVLRGEIADLRWRLAEMERAAGLADIARAPSRNGDLRRFASRA